MPGTPDDDAIRSWIINRIREARDQADLAHTLAEDIDDQVLAAATRRLAEDLEAFARRFATRLSTCDEGVEPCRPAGR